MRDPENADPRKPDPLSEATLRLPAGDPIDPRSTQQLDLSNIISKHQDAGSTLKVPLAPMMSRSDQTQKIVRPMAGESPIRVQKVDLPTEAAGQTQTQKLPQRVEAPKPLGWKLPLALGAMMVLAAAAYLVFSRGPAPLQTAGIPLPAGSGPAPAGAEAYLEQAKAGDAHAMRMLGVMYYYGLNVPQDREKGLYWYRKAVEKGSDAARSELSKIEGEK